MKISLLYLTAAGVLFGMTGCTSVGPVGERWPGYYGGGYYGDDYYGSGYYGYGYGGGVVFRTGHRRSFRAPYYTGHGYRGRSFHGGSWSRPVRFERSMGPRGFYGGGGFHRGGGFRSGGGFHGGGFHRGGGHR